jgi:hypothetical protein
MSNLHGQIEKVMHVAQGHVFPERKRLFFEGTNNFPAFVNMPLPYGGDIKKDTNKQKQSQKNIIFRERSLAPCSKPDEMTTVFMQDVTVGVYEEFLHDYYIDAAMELYAGGGNLALACLKQNKKYSGLCSGLSCCFGNKCSMFS